MTLTNPKAFLLGVCVYAGLLVLLVTVPRLVPVNPDVISAAAEMGYNTGVAIFAAQLWAVLAVLVFANYARQQGNRNTGAPIQTQGQEHLRNSDRNHKFLSNWCEILAVFVIFSAAYIPRFLSSYGPYIEDQYFLSVLQRMHHGQVPYRDFGHIYGPLMIYLAFAWTKIFGYSMSSYYGYLAIIEGLQFALLMGVLQRLVPERRMRYMIFLLLGPLLFNTLMGLNWNGLRRLVPAFVALILAFNPYRKSALGVAVLLLGGHLAYSHDYAIAALLSVIGMYGLMCLRGEGWQAIRSVILLTVGSLIIWFATVGALLGSDVLAYIRHTTEVVINWSGGHMGFPFYWTANSLALFGLLTIACAAIGRGLFKDRTVRLSSGDRLLWCGFCYVLVTLKSGLNRADCWHLNAPFLILMLAMLLPLSNSVFPFGHKSRKLALALTVVVSFTYLIGIYPTWRMYAEGYVWGLRDFSTRRVRNVTPFESRSHAIESERFSPRRQFVELAEYFAKPEFRDREIYFYEAAWFLRPRIGVCSTNYNILVEDMMFEKDLAFLRRHPDAMVILTKSAYERLYELVDPATQINQDPRLQPGISRTAQRWLATVHLDAIATEQRIEHEAWDRGIGDEIRSRYALGKKFEQFFVLFPTVNVPPIAGNEE